MFVVDFMTHSPMYIFFELEPTAVRSRSKFPIYRNTSAVNIDSIAGGSEPAEDDPQDEPVLLLT